MCAGKKGYEEEVHRRNVWWNQEAAERKIQETLADAREERSMMRQGEEVMQWETWNGRRRMGIQDYGSEASNAWVGE